jgi:hypothetical protein
MILYIEMLLFMKTIFSEWGILAAVLVILFPLGFSIWNVYTEIKQKTYEVSTDQF